jgi:KipI family sensor histidine kinase inhibitor
VVAGARSVLVSLREGSDTSSAARHILSAPVSSSENLRPNRVVVPVAYGGPDTDDVASVSRLTPGDLATRHSERDYTVAFLGFSPGFAYLAGGDPALRVPRLPTPRPSVPAGSVALAAEFTAVYPQSTPGGWRIIGRTDMTMFDPSRAKPSVLSPGDTVNFEPVASVGSPRAWPVAKQPSDTAGYVLVLDPGPMTSVQDGGRVGWAHLGVPRAGAADRRSAAFANRLVGNDPTAAVLESTMAGPHLRVGRDCHVAVTGARATVTVDGLPARLDSRLALRSGSEVRVGPYEAGARTYVAFSGGLALEPVLGSRSTDTLSGLGPPPVRAGDTLPLGNESGTAGTYDEERVTAPAPGELLTVEAIRGPRNAWVGNNGMDILAGSVFEVSATSDRTGLRLNGPTVPVDRREEVPPEGMVAGAIQVPPSGSPIVLLRNHPTTGGYPVAAVVTDEGLDSLAQCRPGVRIRFAIA